MSAFMKEWWRNILLLGFSLWITILLGEVVVSNFFPQNLGTWGMTRDGITSHVPNLSVYMTQFKQVVRINSHGMRDREHALQKEPGVFRILVLGDSFMEANQVLFEDSFAALLESKLKGTVSRSVEVVNASVSGWGTDDELTYFQRYGRLFQPDIVLVGMTLHNDVQDNLQEEFHSFQNGRLSEKPIASIPFVPYAILQVKEFLASHSHLYQLMLRGARLSWMQTQAKKLNTHVVALLSKDPDPETVRGWNMTRQLFRSLKRETELNGAKLAIFLIPLWAQVSPDRLDAILDEHHLSREAIILDQPQRMMKVVADEEGIALVDLLKDFQRAAQTHLHELYLQGDGHWTAMGHELAARKMAEYLARQE